MQQSLAAAKVSRKRMDACLDDARTTLVDVVDGGISDGVSRADLNHLDSARVYMNRAVELLTAADQFIGHAQEHVALAFSTNVISGVDTVRDCAGHVDMSECARCYEVLTHLIQSLETQ